MIAPAAAGSYSLCGLEVLAVESVKAVKASVTS
jgi:hypothetical protein